VTFREGPRGGLTAEAHKLPVKSEIRGAIGKDKDGNVIVRLEVRIG
jgi:hypothetical protein